MLGCWTSGRGGCCLTGFEGRSSAELKCCIAGTLCTWSCLPGCGIAGLIS